VAALAMIDTPEKFKQTFAVSRETVERLQIFERLLRQWQKGTNLVSPATLDQIWHRHFADSAQLIFLAPSWRSWFDLGSGAGFPGLVIAICAANREDRRVHFVDSNARKCAFAHEVVRETGCSVEIHQAHIESLSVAGRLAHADLVSARALAPLNELLALAAPFFSSDTTGLFLKGRSWEQDSVEAAANWDYDAVMHPSLTDTQARIIQVNALRRKPARTTGGGT
jgi:16S rRNA (guanine527-N7)-methyltransferase